MPIVTDAHLSKGCVDLGGKPIIAPTQSFRNTPVSANVRDAFATLALALICIAAEMIFPDFDLPRVATLTRADVVGHAQMELGAHFKRTDAGWGASGSASDLAAKHAFAAHSPFADSGVFNFQSPFHRFLTTAVDNVAPAGPLVH